MGLLPGKGVALLRYSEWKGNVSDEIWSGGVCIVQLVPENNRRDQNLQCKRTRARLELRKVRKYGEL